MSSMLRSCRRICTRVLGRRSNSSSSSSSFTAPYLSKCAANYQALTPLTFMVKSAEQYPGKTCYVHNDIKRSWGEVYNRVRRMSSVLVNKFGIKNNDVVSIIAPNTQMIYETHFSVPGAGAIIHTINTRLDAPTIAFQLKHAKSKIVYVDAEFTTVMREALNIMSMDKSMDMDDGNSKLPIVIDIDDKEYSPNRVLCGGLFLEYEALIAEGDETFQLIYPSDEWDAISVNYTSGTTGNPKGVVTHHRGAYLNSLSNSIEWHMARHPRFLWVVPMFHCNGWCFAWTLASRAGESHFLRQVRAESLFSIIQEHRIQFLCGAPVTMNTMLAYKDKFRFKHDVKMWTAGAPPPPAVIKRFRDEIGVDAQTAYGLTETYGPISTHVPDPEWASSGVSDNEQLLKCTLQVGNTTIEGLTVMDPKNMTEVPFDSKTMGEVMIRGNIVMKGYLNNEKATLEALQGGWFHTGDLGVRHPNGRIELKDRSKDIIISGGENISSIEVENIMLTHNTIGEVAVIAMPDEKWGEVPCAFMVLRPNIDPKDALSGEEMMRWAKTKMASFQSPKAYVYLKELPKTSTGKVQKNVLRTYLPNK